MRYVTDDIRPLKFSQKILMKSITVRLVVSISGSASEYQIGLNTRSQQKDSKASGSFFANVLETYNHRAGGQSYVMISEEDNCRSSCKHCR